MNMTELKATIRELATHGKGYDAIAQELNSRGIKTTTGKSFNNQSVFYYGGGKRRYKKRNLNVFRNPDMPQDKIDEIVSIAKPLRDQGMAWKHIGQKLASMGYKRSDGSVIKKSSVCSWVLNKHPEMQQRFFSKKNALIYRKTANKPANTIKKEAALTAVTRTTTKWEVLQTIYACSELDIKVRKTLLNTILEATLF